MNELFYASHMLSGSTLVPAGGHEKVVFAKMLRARHAQCGSRLDRVHLWPMIPGFECTRLPIFTHTVRGDDSEGDKCEQQSEAPAAMRGDTGKFIASVTHISGATYSIPEKQLVPACV
jgi:hypothetical protein